MKWLLLALLIFIVATGRGKLGDLARSIRKLPKDFKDGQKRVDAPEELARDVTPKRDDANASTDSSPRS